MSVTHEVSLSGQQNRLLTQGCGFVVDFQLPERLLSSRKRGVNEDTVQSWYFLGKLWGLGHLWRRDPGAGWGVCEADGLRAQSPRNWGTPPSGTGLSDLSGSLPPVLNHAAARHSNPALTSYWQAVPSRPTPLKSPTWHLGEALSPRDPGGEGLLVSSPCQSPFIRLISIQTPGLYSTFNDLELGWGRGWKDNSGAVRLS